jgi:hypothetical protein
MDYMFEVCMERNIRYLIHGGDVVDRRKYINYNSASILRQHIIDV